MKQNDAMKLNSMMISMSIDWIQQEIGGILALDLP